MKYHFAIDATSIPSKPTGIGNYTLGMIRSLSAKIKIDKLSVFVRNDQIDLFKKIDANIINCGNLSTLKRLIWEQITLPVLVKKHSVDLLHSPNYTIPFYASCKKISTIHDLTSFLFPKRRKLIHGWFFRKMIQMAVNRADMIISVSENTKKDIQKIFRKKVEIKTIYQGFDSILFSTIQKDIKTEHHQSSSIDKPYFLFVSTIEPSKNVDRLVQAFLTFNKSNENRYNLCLVGKLGWGVVKTFLSAIEHPDAKDCVKYLGYQTNDQLSALYKNALAFVYPSLYEGFGIPPLEAMSCGVPVLCSDISSLPEVVGDAALLFNPYDQLEISNAMDKIVKDSRLRNALILKGFKQCKKFSWENAADELLSAYYQLLKS